MRAENRTTLFLIPLLEAGSNLHIVSATFRLSMIFENWKQIFRRDHARSERCDGIGFSAVEANSRAAAIRADPVGEKSDIRGGAKP